MAVERGHILVVDDSRVNRMLLARALEAQDYAVVMAEDGRAALELLRAQRAPAFDVVLMDLLMPEMDGYDALAQIKADPAMRHIPVIMISAVEELESVVRCLELGPRITCSNRSTRRSCGPGFRALWPASACATWSSNTSSRLGTSPTPPRPWRPRPLSRRASMASLAARTR
jgi:CheY-like chemotaxis protein